LGDRACLALGIVLKAPIYTADKAWKNLKLGVRIHVIR
jgi:ribonuclease VapC